MLLRVGSWLELELCRRWVFVRVGKREMFYPPME